MANDKKSKRAEKSSVSHADPVPAGSLKEELAKTKDHGDDNEEEETVKVVQDEVVPATLQCLAGEKCSDEKNSPGPSDGDHALALVEKEKRMALIRAWEDSEKTKAENKAYKNLSAVAAWENGKLAVVEAELRKIEGNLEKKRAEYEEKINNQIANAHKTAEERRATVEAEKRAECHRVEEKAAMLRASGAVPKKSLSCFSR